MRIFFWNKWKKYGVIGLFLLSNCAAAQQYWQPKRLPEFVQQVLIPFTTTSAITEAIVFQNAQLLSKADIQQYDQQWQKTVGIDRFMWDLLTNDCAFELHNLETKHYFIVESFVMDNQGALVCLSNKTSDYWQGDEPKFTESYKNSQGAVYYGELDYDKSSGEMVIQVSLPVMAEGKAIGAITFGISLERWERR